MPKLLNDSGESEVPGNAGIDHAPLDDAVKSHANPHHYIIGSQASLPVDARGIFGVAHGYIVIETLLATYLII